MTPDILIENYAKLSTGYKGTGDRILNAECYLADFARSQPNHAHDLANIIDKNAAALSDKHGVHVDRIRSIANDLRRFNSLG